jgi:hypothetical protein
MLTALVGALVLAAPQKPTRLLPVDESAKDPTLVRFLSSLRKTVYRQNSKELMSRVAPDVRVSFGGDNGSTVFQKRWQPERYDSPVWRELAQVLELGGTFQKGSPTPQFWMPYVYSRFPQNLDAFEYGAIVGRGIPLRQRPSPHGKVLRTLDYNLVRMPVVDEASEIDKRWSHVRLVGGGAGYVRSDEVRSPVDFRMSLAKRNGRWMITAFVAGD